MDNGFKSLVAISLGLLLGLSTVSLKYCMDSYNYLKSANTAAMAEREARIAAYQVRAEGGCAFLKLSKSSRNDSSPSFVLIVDSAMSVSR